MAILSGANVTLGSVTFDPPPQAITSKKDAYVIEHAIPGKEGGNMEYLGSMQPRFQLHGILVESGAENTMFTLLAMKGTPQSLFIGSTNTASGVYFASGSVLVQDVKFDYGAGHGYPYYGFIVDLVLASGAVAVASGVLRLQSNVQVGTGFNEGVPEFGAMRHIPRGGAFIDITQPEFGVGLHVKREVVGFDAYEPAFGVGPHVRRGYVGVWVS